MIGVVKEYKLKADKGGLLITITCSDGVAEQDYYTNIRFKPVDDTLKKYELRSEYYKRQKFCSIINNNSMIFEDQCMLLGYLIGVIHGINCSQASLFGDYLFNVFKKYGIRV